MGDPLIPLFVGVLFLATCAGAGPNLGFSYGYTHYDPDDLNEVNRVFEKTSRAAGFNGYAVERFDGHLEQAVTAGWTLAPWMLSIESEIWKEEFGQNNVAFSFEALSGQLTAREEYLFVPTVLFLKYTKACGPFSAAAGYGAGILMGDASVRISTTYGGARPDDDLRLGISSGISPVQRVALDAGVHLWPWLRLGISAGYRWSAMPYLEVDEVSGSSYIFNLLFNGGAEAGDRLFIGNETLYFVQEQEAAERPFMRRVEGNLSGYTLWLRLDLFNPWRKP